MMSREECVNSFKECDWLNDNCSWFLLVETMSFPVECDVDVWWIQRLDWSHGQSAFRLTF